MGIAKKYLRFKLQVRERVPSQRACLQPAVAWRDMLARELGQTIRRLAIKPQRASSTRYPLIIIEMALAVHANLIPHSQLACLAACRSAHHCMQANAKKKQCRQGGKLTRTGLRANYTAARHAYMQASMTT